MKNTFFLQGEVKGVQAAVVKISDLIKDIPAMQAMDFETVVGILGGNETIMDMVYAALEEGKKFAFTHKSKDVKALFCEAMDSLLEGEVNNLVETLFKAKSLDQMVKWKLSKACSNAIIDLFYLRKELVDNGDKRVAAGIEHRKAAEVNKSEVKIQNKEENVQMVTVKGAGVTEAQVIDMMAAAGLKAGQQATTKLGVGTVVGFEATSAGILVAVQIGEEVKKIMANKVQPGVHEVEAPKAAVSEAASVAIDAISRLMTTEAPWEQEAKGSVDAAVDTAPVEVSEEEEFNAREDIRQEQYNAKQAKANAAGAALSQSAAAQAILDQANKLLKGGGATQASKASGTQTASRPATQSKTQTNGGNVQMENNKGAVQDRPAQGVAGGQTSTRRPGATAATTGQGSGGRATLRASAGTNSTRRPAGTRAQGTGTTAPRHGLALKESAVANRGYNAWYMNPERFANCVSGADFEETRCNEALGITHATFWRPETYNDRFNRETREEELAVLEIEMGAVSFEFRLRYSTNPEAKTPWYCNNITFIEGRNGGRWHYTIGLQSSKYAVIVGENGKIRMATEEDKKDKDLKKQIQYVGDGKWENKRIYGLDLSEEVIAQVMRWAAFGWEAMQTAAE